MMSTTAVVKGVRLSAQKGRLVADLIRGLAVDLIEGPTFVKPLCSGSCIGNRITQEGAFSVFHGLDPSGRSTTA